MPELAYQGENFAKIRFRVLVHPTVFFFLPCNKGILFIGAPYDLLPLYSLRHPKNFVHTGVNTSFSVGICFVLLKIYERVKNMLIRRVLWLRRRVLGLRHS